MQADKRQLERPKSLADVAGKSIRQLIVSGEFSLGEQLSEASLATQLGISKTPVREALLRLRVDGGASTSPRAAQAARDRRNSVSHRQLGWSMAASLVLLAAAQT